MALLIGLSTVASLALLGGRLSHQASRNEANATATTLATQKIEELLAAPHPDTDWQLNPPGGHASQSLDATGLPSVGGPYMVNWFVTNDVPYAGSKQIRVTVTVEGKTDVQSDILTYLVR
ncbi:MAG: hypothetical protein QOD06_2585 [Candidatus Binatota bacterium]|nr:hypothetical protein [Candidatus Binatota bacterium]